MKLEPAISAAQTEVWAWKERAYEVIKHLPPEEWLAAIQRQTRPLANEIRVIIAAREAAEVAAASRP